MAQWHSGIGAVAQWHSGSGVELQTLQEENPDSNPVLPCQTVGTFFTLHCSSSLSCVNEYLAIDIGG